MIVYEARLNGHLNNTFIVDNRKLKKVFDILFRL